MDRATRWLAAAITAGVIGAVSVTGGDHAEAAADEETADELVVHRVEVSAEDERADRPPVVADGLAPATVLEISARGFPPGSVGTVAQCIVGAGCHEALPVRFDDDGNARFQYLVAEDVTDQPGGARCRAGDPRCTVDLRVEGTTVQIDTLFGDEAPDPGTLTVDPSASLRPGDRVDLHGQGFPPGAQLRLRPCADGSDDERRCAPPFPESGMTVDGAGRFTTDLVVPAAVGEDRVACDRTTTCLVRTEADDVGVWARPLVLDYAAAPGADYQSGRVVAGLAIGALAAAIGLWLVRTTDWRPPAEADGSLIDDAPFADLDAEAEAFPTDDRTAAATPDGSP